MAKTSKIHSNLRRIEMSKKFAEKRERLLSITRDVNLTFEERNQARLKLEKMPRDSAKIRIRTRCRITGRPRGNFAKFQLCRLVFRQMAHKGELPGVIKASW